jgi:hypothetical protein
MPAAVVGASVFGLKVKKSYRADEHVQVAMEGLGLGLDRCVQLVDDLALPAERI